MTSALRGPCCGHDADGLTRYRVAGVVRLLVCAGCDEQLVGTEHQPYSRVRRRLQQLMASMTKEVVSDEGLGRCVEGKGTIRMNREHNQETLVCVS